MMDRMSPLTRRIAAIGLLLLVLLLFVQLVAAPLVGAIGDARTELAGLRARQARLSATTARLLPDSSTVLPGMAISARTDTLAAQRLQALLAGSASVAGVSLQQGVAHKLSGPSRLLGAEIVAVGPEAGLTNFASLVEHGSPAIRFRHWRLTTSDTSDKPMELTGLVVAAWNPLP